MIRIKFKWFLVTALGLLFFRLFTSLNADPKFELTLELKGDTIIENSVELEFQINPWDEVDGIELIVSSECFHEPSLEGNMFLPQGEKNNFKLLPFQRTKDLSRTRQSFRLERVKASKKPTNARLIYRSPLPEAALDYPIQVNLFKGPNLSTSKIFNLKVKPGPTVHVLCDWIESKSAPKIKCLGLDRKGNHATDAIQISGSFLPEKPPKEYSFTNGIIIPPEQPLKPYTRFYYRFQEKTLQSSALPNPEKPIFFGDLHTHSSFSDSRVPAKPRDLLTYARESSLLDFVAITDHAEGVFGEPLTHEEFKATANTLAEFNSPGKFTTFLGFEWTSTFYDETSPYGHRTIIYPQLVGLPYRSDQEITDTPEKLYSKTGKVFAFPHHTMISWGSFNFEKPIIAEFEKGIEIYSAHGTSEELDRNGRMREQIMEGSIRRGIARQYPFRIMASSDTHGAHPGLNDWPGVTPGMLDGGGLIAVFSPINTREKVFEALNLQEFYGTSGTRILLEPASWNCLFPIHIYGTHQLQEAEVIEFITGEESRTVTYPLEGLESTLEHSIENKVFAYYLRVTQIDGERAWMGPVYTNSLQTPDF